MHQAFCRRRWWPFPSCCLHTHVECRAPQAATQAMLVMNAMLFTDAVQTVVLSMAWRWTHPFLRRRQACPFMVMSCQKPRGSMLVEYCFKTQDWITHARVLPQQQPNGPALKLSDVHTRCVCWNIFSKILRHYFRFIVKERLHGTDIFMVSPFKAISSGKHVVRIFVCGVCCAISRGAKQGWHTMHAHLQMYWICSVWS